MIYSIFKLTYQEPAMDGMCNFLKRFFEIFYFSLEVHRNLGDSGCSDVWELMSLLLCSAEGHFSGGLVRGSCPGATPREGANLLRSQSCSYTFWWVRGTASSLWAQMFGEEAAERCTGWRDWVEGWTQGLLPSRTAQAKQQFTKVPQTHWQVSAQSPAESKPSQSEPLCLKCHEIVNKMSSFSLL